MGELHAASARDLDAAPERSLQRRAADQGNPLLNLQAQAGNAAVSRMIRDSGSLEVQRSCGCSGAGCSCGAGEQAEDGAAGAESQGAELTAVHGGRS